MKASEKEEIFEQIREILRERFGTAHQITFKLDNDLVELDYDTSNESALQRTEEIIGEILSELGCIYKYNSMLELSDDDLTRDQFLDNLNIIILNNVTERLPGLRDQIIKDLNDIKNDTLNKDKLMKMSEKEEILQDLKEILADRFSNAHQILFRYDSGEEVFSIYDIDNDERYMYYVSTTVDLILEPINNLFKINDTLTKTQFFEQLILLIEKDEYKENIIFKSHPSLYNQILIDLKDLKKEKLYEIT